MVATRRLIPYAAVLAAALAVGACSGADPAPAETLSARTGSTASSATSPTSSAEPTTTASPSASEDPVLAKIPKEARPETQKGAEAFAGHFLTALSRAAKTADPTPLLGLTSDACETCTAMVKSIDALQKSEQHHAGETIRVMDTDAISQGNGKAVVRVKVKQMAVDVLDKNGQKVGRTSANEGAFVATMSYKQNHWVIDKLQTMAS